MSIKWIAGAVVPVALVVCVGVVAPRLVPSTTNAIGQVPAFPGQTRAH